MAAHNSKKIELGLVTNQDLYEEVKAIRKELRLQEKPLTQQEIADFLGWKKLTVIKYMCCGQLPFVLSPTGGKYSYRSWLNKWLAGVPVEEIYQEDGFVAQGGRG